MSSTQNNSGVYAIINKIPNLYRSYHLRSYFSLFVESGGFICFHYIHRAEVGKHLNSSSCDGNGCVSNCCIVKVVADRVHELLETYNGRHWLNGNGEALPTCCFIKELKLSDNGNSICGGYRWAIPKNLPVDHEKLSTQEVESLSEMRPPYFMPNGNVGTTTDQLLKTIDMRRLPLRIIRKLLRQFPSRWAREIYSEVEFYYKSKKDRWKFKSNIFNSMPVLRPSFHNRYWDSQLPGECSYWEEKIPYYTEEWYRYGALYDDVYEQERTFEEKVRLNYENKGSGLVSYTDAQYWDAREGHFDAEISDWDIDARIHEEPRYRSTIPKNLLTDGEKISIQYVKPLPEMYPPSFLPNGNVESNTDLLTEIPVYRLPLRVIPIGVKFPGSQSRGIYSDVEFDYNAMSRKNIWKSKNIKDEPGVDNNKESQKNDVEVDQRYEFAGFEKYNKGIGRKILEAQGWKQGQGIGKNCNGIAEPLPNEGQSNKKGFGYGVKLEQGPPTKKRCRQPDDEKAVSTINDDPKVSETPESVPASSPNAKLKYWQ